MEAALHTVYQQQRKDQHHTDRHPGPGGEHLPQRPAGRRRPLRPVQRVGGAAGLRHAPGGKRTGVSRGGDGAEHGAHPPAPGAVQPSAAGRAGHPGPEPVRWCRAEYPSICAPHHHGPPGTARPVGGERDRELSGLCKERGLQRDIPHLGACRHPGQRAGHHLLRPEPGVYRILPQPGL